MTAGPIYHSGHVVDDLQAAMRHWRDLASAAPFCVFNDFEFVRARYLDQPVEARASLAFAFSGNTLIELIQPLAGDQRIYATRGPHHIGMLVDDLDLAIAGYVDAGAPLAFRAAFAFGGGCAFIDTRAQLGLYTELVVRLPLVESMLGQMHAAHAAWNGRDLEFELSG